jgi:catechol 2,3-dioxygenase-like lactoylglutathione lyase family enzyme
MPDLVSGFDSVVFETPDLPRVRDFYSRVLGLRVGTFDKDGQTVADESDNYVNFDVGGALLGFERGKAAQLGTVVLRCLDVGIARTELGAAGIEPVRSGATFLIIHDPDGREVILQAN